MEKKMKIQTPKTKIVASKDVKMKDKALEKRRIISDHLYDLIEKNTGEPIDRSDTKMRYFIKKASVLIYGCKLIDYKNYIRTKN